MWRKTFNVTVGFVKQRPFELDPRIRISDVFVLLFTKIFELINGLWYFRQFIFIGKGRSFSCKRKIYLTRGITIGANCQLSGLSEHGLRIGDSSSIGSHSIIKVSGTLTNLGHGITIGRNVGIGDFAHIGGAGGVEIGDDTIIGGYFSTHPENHVFSDKQILIREQGVTRKGIHIGSNCWIGAKVTLLDGAKVGDGCVIAAGAVVKGEFPDNCVIGGVPARILKER
jgi:acetyltransferase-like isoleucine patch superfamily enzyme